jgi:hypothetical protein
MNMVKELACMAYELPSEDENMPTTGTCVACGTWGPAFQECLHCGIDSGCLFIPDRDTNYENSNTTEQTASDNEDAYEDFDDVTPPKYFKTVFKNMVDATQDKLSSLSIEQLFFMVAQDTFKEVSIYELEIHVEHRLYCMELFKYDSIPTIMQNIEVLNFNVTLHNHYIQVIKLSQRPLLLTEFPSREIIEIVKYGTFLMQINVLNNGEIPFSTFNQAVVQYRNERLDARDRAANVICQTLTQYLETESAAPSADIQDLPPSEFSCAMTDKPWNFHRKKRFDNHVVNIPRHMEHLMSMHEVQMDKWLADSGSSCHFTNVKHLQNSRDIYDVIQTGDGHKAVAVKQGDLTLQV